MILIYIMMFNIFYLIFKNALFYIKRIASVFTYKCNSLLSVILLFKLNYNSHLPFMFDLAGSRSGDEPISFDELWQYI